jgi:LmbE family N-acetylglucosaminyl deacetylase
VTQADGRVLVMTAHPDDPEFAAGGTIAKLATEGREVTYVIATNGNKGSGDRAISPEELVRVRQEEQRNAAQVLGVARVASRPPDHRRHRARLRLPAGSGSSVVS